MRSDLMKKGASRAPHRSLLKALGITDSEMERPFVAVVSSKSDYIPGHTHLDKITRAVEDGIRSGGRSAVHLQYNRVCDGLAMNHKGMKYSLCSRELIADSIEMLTAHPMDAAVFIPNCDKIVPGMLMAAWVNIPSIFVSGGPCSRSLEAAGSASPICLRRSARAAGRMDEAELARLENSACPGRGSCAGMFTANS